MILITVISVILAFLIIGSMISEKYFLGIVLILASVALLFNTNTILEPYGYSTVDIKPWITTVGAS